MYWYCRPKTWTGFGDVTRCIWVTATFERLLLNGCEFGSQILTCVYWMYLAGPKFLRVAIIDFFKSFILTIRWVTNPSRVLVFGRRYQYITQPKSLNFNRFLSSFGHSVSISDRLLRSGYTVSYHLLYYQNKFPKLLS